MCEAENIYFYSREVMRDTVIKPDQLALTRQITRNKWHHSHPLMSSQEPVGSQNFAADKDENLSVQDVG